MIWFQWNQVPRFYTEYFVPRFLHSEMMFAAAQKRYVYIYDHSGMELHCLKQMTQINRLTFLPYHFLLVAAVSQGCCAATTRYCGAMG